MEPTAVSANVTRGRPRDGDSLVLTHVPPVRPPQNLLKPRSRVRMALHPAREDTPIADSRPLHLGPAWAPGNPEHN